MVVSLHYITRALLIFRIQNDLKTWALPPLPPRGPSHSRSIKAVLSPPPLTYIFTTFHTMSSDQIAVKSPLQSSSDNENETVSVRLEAKKERVVKASDAVKSVRRELLMTTIHMTRKGIEACVVDCDDEGLEKAATAKPWQLMMSVQEVWGSSEEALAKIQTLLKRTATALADVSATPIDTLRKQLGPDTADAAAATKVLALNCLQTLYYLDHSVRTSCTVLRLCIDMRDVSRSSAGKVSEVRDDEISAGLARFSNMEQDDDLTKYQSLVLFLLNQAYIRGYRRYGTYLYARHTTACGKDTRAWKKACVIRDFVYEVTRKEINFAQWCNLTANISNANSVTDYLTNCRDMQLPELKKHRNVFSFNNGVYVTSEDAFYPHSSNNCAVKLHNHSAVLAGSGGNSSSILSDEVVACKFFDLNFEEYPKQQEWYDIPTPNLQGILDHQKFEPDVCKWLYVFIGRLLYEVNTMDGWQVIPFFKGQAGTGKSTLLMRVCAGFFEHEDVGVLSNNIERKFGLSAIVDKLLFVAPEIKGDLQMEQAEFQSVVSGEACQINIKYKKAETLSCWTVPGVLAGNEVPNWVDNSGSVSRRMVLFDFCHRVDNADMELGKKLAQEIPAILLKCNRAYLEAVEKYAKDSIWKHLPKYFLQTKQDLMESVNSLENFLTSTSVVVDKQAYMPMEDFVGQYHLYCDNRSLPRMKVNKDFRDRLANHSIFVDKKARMVYPRDGTGMLTGGVEWLLGVDIRRASYQEQKEAPSATPDCGGDF